MDMPKTKRLLLAEIKKIDTRMKKAFIWYLFISFLLAIITEGGILPILFIPAIFLFFWALFQQQKRSKLEYEYKFWGSAYKPGIKRVVVKEL